LLCDFFFQEDNSRIIIDETQLLPQFFQALMGVINQDKQRKVRFVITGSSSFELIDNSHYVGLGEHQVMASLLGL
jgi:predicted AAA+ superfamily ATPase